MHALLRWMEEQSPVRFRSSRILGISRALCTLNLFSTGTLVTVCPDLLRRRFSTGRKSSIFGTLGLMRADRQPRASRAGASASRRARSANQRSLFRMPPYTPCGGHSPPRCLLTSGRPGRLAETRKLSTPSRAAARPRRHRVARAVVYTCGGTLPAACQLGSLRGQTPKPR